MTLPGLWGGALVLGPPLVFKSDYLLRRKSPWKPPGSCCSRLEMRLPGVYEPCRENKVSAAVTFFCTASRGACFWCLLL